MDTSALISAEDEAFARSKGFIPGGECGWSTPDLWVSIANECRVFPFIQVGELKCWSLAFFARAGDNVPFASSDHPTFRDAISAGADS